MMTDFIISVILLTSSMIILGLVFNSIKKRHQEDIDYWIDENEKLRNKIQELEYDVARANKLAEYCKNELKKANLEWLQNSDRN